MSAGPRPSGTSRKHPFGVDVRLGRARAVHALRIWPNSSEWSGCLGVGVLASVAILLLGFSTGLLAWRPVDAGGPLLLLRVLILPSLLEETVFRGALMPDRQEEPRPLRAIAPGLGIFVLWHVGAGLIVPGAAVFLRADFLLSAGLLGLACAVMRWRTGSLWPGVAFHAVAVWAWLGFLGGPEPF